MVSALSSTHLDRNYILLLQTSLLSVRLFYLGLEPKREKQSRGKMLKNLGKLKNKNSFVTALVLLSTTATKN